MSIDAGHDISLTNNRVVSCGQDGFGHWLTSNGYAYSLWNASKTHQFHDNQISGNTGDFIELNAQGKPIDSDFWMPDVSIPLNNRRSDNAMDRPCWVNGALSQAAEDTELLNWQSKVSAATEVLGDQH